ncbi:MAG TPA: recombination mediator RecR [Patescibacteria group bacterium]|nr:recombination mediator RecR [Patescibacteria group bacterium]
MYPKLIQNLIYQFAKLPSIGPKTAERLVFYLLNQPESRLHEFAEAIEHIKENITICQICYNFSTDDPCHICSDSQRSKELICVVAKPQDVEVLEKTGSFAGLYHILGGYIQPTENLGPEKLKIKELISRVKNNGIKEIILALNPDMVGETTTLYLSKLLNQFPDLKVTRLARGLPMGADLEYADEVTLENAMMSRIEINNK